MNDTFLDAVRGDARGRWLDILPALAPDLADACTRPGKHVPCPVHGGKDGFRLFKDAQETGGGICNTCNNGKAMAGGFDVLQWVNGWDFPRALAEVAEYLETDNGHPSTLDQKPPRNAPREAEDNPNAGKHLSALWKEAVPDPGRIADYLRHRGLSGTVAEGLRYHPALPYYEDGKEMGTFPAMLAHVESIAGEMVAIHRTYLDPAGPGKAPVESPKKLTQAIRDGATRGAAIRLSEAGETLALAEGIETALAVLEATGTPAWATVSAGGLEAVELPPGVSRVEVWADHDESGVGQRAAEVLAARCALKGLDVRLMLPPGDGRDWLDVLNEEGPEAPGSSPGQALRRARDEAEPWEPRVLAQAREELSRLEAEETDEEELSAVSWEGALMGALVAEDPIAALKEEVIPRLAPLEGVGLDAALRRTVEAYREYGIRLDTLRREARTARQKANQAKKVRRETIASHWETLSQRDAILRSLVSKGHTDAADRAAPPPAAEEEAEDDGRPTIKVLGGHLREHVNRAEALLLRAGGIFQRDRLLVRVVRTTHLNSPIKEITRPIGALVVHAVDPAWLAEELGGLAHWKKFDARKNGLKKIDCPSKVAITLQARAQWGFPPLLGVIAAPTLRYDGSIVEKAGYDDDTGLVFDPGSTAFPPIPVSPTRDDALSALGFLAEMLNEFPFERPEDRSVALSGILTGLIRRSLRSAPLHGFSAPLHGFSAPKARAGKSLLADICAKIATGVSATVLSQAKDPEEERKRLVSILMEGDAIVSIDNVERPLRSDVLCSILTQPLYKDRLWGMNRTVTVPTSTFFMATGNNLAICGDLSCRALVCYLDPNTERPEEREFKRDMNEYIKNHRHELVVAALTVLRAYHVAGRPKQDISPYGGFEDWSNWVRAALVWLGQADPCLTRRRLEEGDDERSNLRAFLLAWYKAFGETKQTLAEVARKIEKNKGEDGKWECEDEELRNAVLMVAGTKGGGAVDMWKLGSFFRRFNNRIEAGLRLKKVGSIHKVALWCVKGRPELHSENFTEDQRPEPHSEEKGGSGGSVLSNARKLSEESVAEQNIHARDGEPLEIFTKVAETDPPDPPDPPKTAETCSSGGSSAKSGLLGETSGQDTDLSELVDAFRREEVMLTIEDGDLRVTGDLKPGMTAVIERHKPALMALLQEGNPFED